MVAAQFSRETMDDRNGRGSCMLIRVFTLCFSQPLQGFDDSHVVEFLKDKKVVSMRDHFFLRNEEPYLALVALYEPQLDITARTGAGGGKGKRDESWRKLLNDENMPLFESMRGWRAERCKQDGVPPYVICNNRQLAKITAGRPQSLAGLMEIEGFGKAKAEKYGAEMLKILTMSATKDKDE